MSPTKSVPPIDLKADVEVKDSCNCCRKCEINCCFPRKVRHHRHDGICTPVDPAALRADIKARDVLYSS